MLHHGSPPLPLLRQIMLKDRKLWDARCDQRAVPRSKKFPSGMTWNCFVIPFSEYASRVNRNSFARSSP